MDFENWITLRTPPGKTKPAACAGAPFACLHSDGASKGSEDMEALYRMGKTSDVNVGEHNPI